MDFMTKWIKALFSLLFVSNLAFAEGLFAGAPCWVTNASCVSEKSVAVGISNVAYSVNAQLATLQAHNDAIANLALITNSTVTLTSSNNKVTNYSNRSSLWVQTSQEQASVISNVSLQGVKCIDKWIDRNDTLYILVVVDQSHDITNIKVQEAKADYTSSSPIELYKSVIKSNMDYASQLTQSIRAEVKDLTH